MNAPTIFNRSFFILALLLTTIISHGQTYYLSQILEGMQSESGSKNQAVRFISKNANTSGGEVIVEMNQNRGDCRERHKLRWSFDREITTLKPGDVFNIDMYAEPITADCASYINSFIATSGSFGEGGVSHIVNKKVLQNANLNKLKYGRLIGGAKDVWAKIYEPTGHAQNSIRLDENPRGDHLAMFVRVRFSRSSGGSSRHSMDYFFVYLWNTQGGLSEEIGCPKPDCSDFPGTVPVWNFNTDKGECWCPEGMIFSTSQNKCINR